MWELLIIIVPSAIAYTMPLLRGALGGLYSERSGVTNLCIEGYNCKITSYSRL